MNTIFKTACFFSVFLLIFLCSCSPFSKIASETVIEPQEAYLGITNSQAGFKALTFGDFHFANTKKDYRTIHNGKSPFRNILVYGQTSQPFYEYYILINPTEIDPHQNTFLVKDTLMGKSRFVMLISKDAPQKDISFLQKNFSAKATSLINR